MLTQYIDLLSTAHAQYMLFLAAYAMCMSTVQYMHFFATNTLHNGKCYAVLPPKTDIAKSQGPKSHGWAPLR